MTMIVFGTRLFGKVDDVPGAFHVATRFFHVSFLPLIPTSSWIVLEDSKESGFMSSSWSGVQLPSLSWSSIGMAWLRVLSIYGTIGLACVALVGKHDGGQIAIPALLALVCLGTLLYSYKINKMTAERIEAFSRLPGVPSELVAHAKQHLAQERAG